MKNEKDLSRSLYGHYNFIKGRIAEAIVERLFICLNMVPKHNGFEFTQPDLAYLRRTGQISEERLKNIEFGCDFVFRSVEKNQEGLYNVYQVEVKFSKNRKVQKNRLSAYDNNDLNYMRYQAILDDRTRPNNAANDGITRKVDDPFWNTNLPPLGYNCRCFVLNLDKEDAGKVTPKSKTESDSVKPDDGWSYNKVEPVKDVTKYYRDKAKIFNETLKEASLNRLMLRNQDNELWYEKNKNVFTKPENDK